MNKNELIRAIAQKTNLNMEDSGKALDATLEAVVESVNKGEHVVLLGFGSFSIAERKERMGHNPSSGKAMLIPSKKVIKFKAGSKMNPK